MRYAYEKPDGEIVWHEQLMSEGDPPKEIRVGDVVAKRCYRAEQKGGTSSAGWPMTCLASGVHPDDAQKLRDEFKRVGVPTEVNKDGDPIYVSAAHRRRALKARGMFDKQAYY